MSKEIQLLTEIRDLLIEIRDAGKEKPAKKREKKSSKYKGVTLCSVTGKWKAQAYINSKVIGLGYFDEEIDAAREFDKAIIKYKLPLSKLNFQTTVDEDKEPVRVERKPAQKTNISDALASLNE